MNRDQFLRVFLMAVLNVAMNTENKRVNAKMEVVDPTWAAHAGQELFDVVVNLHGEPPQWAYDLRTALASNGGIYLDTGGQ